MRHSRTIRPLALPAGRQKVAAGMQCSVAGWGLTQQDGQLARVLRELDVHVLDARMCNNSRFWHGGITPDMLCLEAMSRNWAPCKVRGMGDSPQPGANQRLYLPPSLRSLALAHFSDAETEAQRLNDLPTVTQSGVGGDGV